MNLFLKLSIILLFISVTSCSKTIEVEEIKEVSVDLQMIEAYDEGMKQLNEGQSLIAVKKFNEAELLFPQSKWAPRSALMSAYAYYDFSFYSDAISEVDRFLKTYPNSKRKDYAYYLKAMSFYNQIVDEKKDLGPILEAKQNFQFIISEYPESEYAMDASFKLELIEEILAAKEMHIGRFYLKKEKWIPAINRFKKVIKDYDRTIYAEEALHRLVEVYYRLGLLEEAKQAAAVLGYNYGSGDWYKKSYKVFNKQYKSRENNNKEMGLIRKKIKSLFE